MAALLIKNADYVVTVDRERRIIRDGAVAVNGDRIAAVGKTSDLAPAFEADEVIDAAGKLVMPGLIDTHVHQAQQLGRGLADEAYAAERLFKRLWIVEAHMEPEDALCAARLCQLELIRSGTTCFADPGNYFPAQMAQAVKESGLRGIIARTAFDIGPTSLGDVPAAFRQTTEEALVNAEETVSRYNGTLEGRLKAWFSMRVPIACSDELLRRMGRLAERYGVGIIGHACENRDEVVAAHLRYGMGDITRLEKLGVLGPSMLLLHVGWLDSGELLLLRDRDVKVSLGPGASLHQAQGNLARGKAPEMLALGITVSLGSDSAMSGNFLDPIRQAYLVVGAYHEARLDPKVIAPERAVEMITLGGARATLWEQEIGSLEVGKRADIAILDTLRPEWQPIHNPIANLVYSAHGGCADTVIVDGKVVMRDRKVRTLNEDDLYREARERAASLARRAGLDAVGRPAWPVI